MVGPVPVRCLTGRERGRADRVRGAGADREGSAVPFASKPRVAALKSDWKKPLEKDLLLFFLFFFFLF